MVLARSYKPYSVLSIDPSIQLLAFNHLRQLLIDRSTRRSKLLVECVQRNTREWNKVLNDTFASDQIVKLINELLQVDVEEIVEDQRQAG